VLIFIIGIIPPLVKGRTHKGFYHLLGLCLTTSWNLHITCVLIEMMHYFIYLCLSTHKLIHSNYYIFEIIIIQVFLVKRQPEKKTLRNAHTYTGKNHGKFVRKQICIFLKIVRKKLYFEEICIFSQDCPIIFPVYMYNRPGVDTGIRGYANGGEIMPSTKRQ